VFFIGYLLILTKFNTKINNPLMKKLLLSFLSVLTVFMANAQVASYSFAQNSGSYVPITGGTVLATAASHGF